MAIFKANYCKRGPEVKNLAKASVRYIQHRRDRDGEKITRALHGPDGEMERYDAYRMIDEAKKGSFYYRFVISPDPQQEDHHHDLDMRDIAMQTMVALEERLGVPLNWVGATHSDHAPHLHAHLIAVVPQKLDVKDLELLREKATHACFEQRLFLDHSLYRERERPYPLPAFDIDTSAPFLDALSDSPAPRRDGDQEALPEYRQAIRYTSRTSDGTWFDRAGGTASSSSLSRNALPWGRYEKSSRQISTGGSSPPQRTWRTCTCPRCQAVHVHNTRDPVHQCSCGFVLHRQKQLRLHYGKGRELGWQH